MSDKTDTVATPPKEAGKPLPFKWDDSAVKKKLAEVNDYYKAFAGKPGYNPYIYLLLTVRPLEFRVNNGEQTTELQSAIMALVCKEPTV